MHLTKLLSSVAASPAACRWQSSNSRICVTLIGIFTLFTLAWGCEDCNTGIPARFQLRNKHQENDVLNNDEFAAAMPTTDAPPKLKLLRANSRTDAIPIDFYRELDNVTDMSEFVERFVNKDLVGDPQLGSVQDTFKRSIERAAFEIPKSAACMPENAIVQLIPLTPPEDLKIIYIPKCTRVKRCSGCCNSELMSCQPTSTEVRNFQVTKYRYGERLTLVGKEIIPVEEHTKCKCACRIKAEHCNSYQIYRPELCRCQCTNDDAFEKCVEQEHKIWDEDDCRCICRENQSCTTGTFFDENLCKCVHPDNPEIPPESNIQDRRRFIVKAVPVETDESTVYTTVP